MLIDKLEEIAKNRGFFWPSQEIYGGVSGFYDYGPLGTLMKKHIEGMILDYYVMEEGCLAIESPVLTTIDPWVASGHVENFADKLTECGKCGEAYRADHLVEEHTMIRLLDIIKDSGISKEVETSVAHGPDFTSSVSLCLKKRTKGSKESVLNALKSKCTVTNDSKLSYHGVKIDIRDVSLVAGSEKVDIAVDGSLLFNDSDINEIIHKNGIKCPKCKGALDKVYDYNLMFKTFIGPGNAKLEGALRPETAQTTYMPFRRLYEIARRKMPFGAIQIGRSFRNEISPRKAVIRQREFSQAEIQFFTPPGIVEWKGFDNVASAEALVLPKGAAKEKKMSMSRLVSQLHVKQPVAYFLARSLQLYKKMGMDAGKLRLRQHEDDERSFYSSDTWDVEFLSEKYGVIELVGVADRSDYDLKRHQQVSKQSMEITHEGAKFVPHVIETAYGIDRALICVMESVMHEEKERLFFSFPASVAPYQVAVFPLVRKDGMPEKAREIFAALRKHFYCAYDETGSIGRMYYRQDEAGTPFCITVDYDTMKNDTVTLRDRDTQKQVIIKIGELDNAIARLADGESIEKVGVLLQR